MRTLRLLHPHRAPGIDCPRVGDVTGVLCHFMGLLWCVLSTNHPALPNRLPGGAGRRCPAAASGLDSGRSGSRWGAHLLRTVGGVGQVWTKRSECAPHRTKKSPARDARRACCNWRNPPDYFQPTSLKIFCASGTFFATADRSTASGRKRPRAATDALRPTPGTAGYSSLPAEKYCCA